jgi:hypothetical protein
MKGKIKKGVYNVRQMLALDTISIASEMEKKADAGIKIYLTKNNCR